MTEKVVIKIKTRRGEGDYTAPFGFDPHGCYCFGVEAGKVEISTRDAVPMQEALDTLEQMYEDLFGGD